MRGIGPVIAVCLIIWCLIFALGFVIVQAVSAQ